MAEKLTTKIQKYFSKKLFAGVLLAGLFTPGCGAVSFYTMQYPQKFDKPPLEYVVNKDKDKLFYKIPEVKKSPTNKYALLIKGYDKGLYIHGDIKNVAKLLLLKDYSIYYVDPNNSKFFPSFCERLGQISDDKTKLFVLMTGHGSTDGFTISSYRGSKSRIEPDEFFENLQKVKGKKAVLIQACYSGIFYEHLLNKYSWIPDKDYFKGVLFTSSPADKFSLADPLLGMSAAVYGFCNYFAASPNEEEDLSEIGFDGEMTPLSEFFVLIKSLFVKRKSSYDVQRFKTTKFKF